MNQRRQQRKGSGRFMANADYITGTCSQITFIPSTFTLTCLSIIWPCLWKKGNAIYQHVLNVLPRLAFMIYSLFVLGFSTYMIYRVVPRYGNKTPIVNISICSLVGSITVMASKGFGIALKLTFSGSNQLTHPSTYVFAVLVGVCIVVQMNYFNKALDMFSTNV